MSRTITLRFGRSPEEQSRARQIVAAIANRGACRAGGWMDVGRGDERFICTLPADHEGDHREGEVTWVRR